MGEEKPLCDERPRVTPRGAVAPFEGVPSGSRYPGRYEPAPDTPALNIEKQYGHLFVVLYLIMNLLMKETL